MPWIVMSVVWGWNTHSMFQSIADRNWGNSMSSVTWVDAMDWDDSCCRWSGSVCYHHDWSPLITRLLDVTIPYMTLQMKLQIQYKWTCRCSTDEKNYNTVTSVSTALHGSFKVKQVVELRYSVQVKLQIQYKWTYRYTTDVCTITIQWHLSPLHCTDHLRSSR